jgi:hypothetical protein
MTENTAQGASAPTVQANARAQLETSLDQCWAISKILTHDSIAQTIPEPLQRNVADALYTLLDEALAKGRAAVNQLGMEV